VVLQQQQGKCVQMEQQQGRQGQHGVAFLAGVQEGGAKGAARAEAVAVTAALQQHCGTR
jgi:hypothetical protein